MKAIINPKSIFQNSLFTVSILTFFFAISLGVEKIFEATSLVPASSEVHSAAFEPGSDQCPVDCRSGGRSGQSLAI